MDCLEFDRRWDALLDLETAAVAAGGAEPGLDPELDEHAATCPRCGPSHARYQTLRRAIRAWAPAVTGTPPTAELIDRVLAAAAAPPGVDRRWVRDRARRRAALGWAMAAAATLLAVALVARPRLAPRAPHEPARSPRLSEALAGATAATWGLAQSTTGEAAEFGRRMLESAAPGGEAAPRTEDESPSGFLSFSPASPSNGDGGGPDGGAGSGWLRDVGEGLSTSVRPLSTTAERAFGFLRVRAPGVAAQPDSAFSSKGA